MLYFPCSPEHKIFLLFTRLNNEDTNIFWDVFFPHEYSGEGRGA